MENQELLDSLDKVGKETMDLININCYRRTLEWLRQSDGIKTIYDEIVEISKRNGWDWEEPRTEQDDKEETYKRKLIPSLQEIEELNSVLNKKFE